MDIANTVLVRGLHLLPPERAHALAIWALKRRLVPDRAARISSQLATGFCDLATRVCGFSLPHPLGLAAGFDKDAQAPLGLFDLGFSFAEIGTVTPRAQPGNPRPRLFRLDRQQALINRMGFDNDGIEAVCRRLKVSEARRSRCGPLGANIGANRDSTDPAIDYVGCLRKLYPLVDYVTVNVSSPNTPGLRDLQRRDRLDQLLGALLEVRVELAAGDVCKPLLLKIAPDLTAEAEADIAEVALARGIDGLIISNTTVDRPDGLTGQHRHEAGGLSGPPLFSRSTKQLGRFFRLAEGRLPLIGVGGIASGADAYAKIRAGASALQLHTALTYQGWTVVERILRELDRLLAEDGYSRIGDAIGGDLSAAIS